MWNQANKYPKLKMTIKMEGPHGGGQTGDIEIELYNDTTPRIVDSFVEACKDKKMDGKVFRRITPNAMLEGGWESNDPIGEVNFGRRHTSAGVLTTPIIKGTYATAGPAQFGICTSPMPWLDGQNVVFGRVVNRDDLRFLDRVAARAGTLTGLPRPRWTVTLVSCEVLPAERKATA